MIIGITGAIGSGKDTIADYLIKNHDFVRLSFAGKVKDVAHVVFGWDRELLEGLTKESREWREIVDPHWGISPRVALQRIGTEMFRTHIHPDTWVKAVVRTIQSAPEKNYVITDCRFENEMIALKSLGGKILHVSRGSQPSWAEKACLGDPCPSSVHITDWNVFALKRHSDNIIDNNSTIENLHSHIKNYICSSDDTL